MYYRAIIEDQIGQLQAMQDRVSTTAGESCMIAHAIIELVEAAVRLQGAGDDEVDELEKYGFL